MTSATRHESPANSFVSATSHVPLNLLDLPFELIQCICSLLPANSVAKLGATCKKLHKVVGDDVHWKNRFLDLGLQHPGDSSFPFDSWKELFLAHYPFWFIPQRKIWFADGAELDGGFCGQLLIARYHPRTGNIEGYALVGEQGQPSVYAWPEKPSVNIHVFHPRVRLHLAQPVLRLRGTPWREHRRMSENKSEAYGRQDNLKGLQSLRPAGNDLNFAHHIMAQVMLTRAIEPSLQHTSMRLWPPARLPAIDRVRRHTPSVFSRRVRGGQTAHNDPRGASFDRPTTHDDVCQSAFRFQRQVGGRMAALFEMLNHGGSAVFGGDGRAALSMPSGVATFATLPESAFEPTPEKPYQGIWVGDYAGHGCEFLLIRQKVSREEIHNSENFGPKNHGRRSDRHMLLLPLEDVSDDETGPDLDFSSDAEHAADESEDGDHEEQSALSTAQDGSIPTSTGTSQQSGLLQEGSEHSRHRHPRKRRRFRDASGERSREAPGETGRLEAIKLTGDPNIPRGEFTFVAEEIGKEGEVYIAQSEEFKDKRAVHCWGHIAAHGFTDDVFVKTDLILVSHDCLAQHWHDFGHVAFYRRVQVEKFFDPLSGNVELAL